jgi:hypothetical protein
MGDEESEHPVVPEKQENRPNGIQWREGDAVTTPNTEPSEER